MAPNVNDPYVHKNSSSLISSDSCTSENLRRNMSQGVDWVYDSLVLLCGTSRLL